MNYKLRKITSYSLIFVMTFNPLLLAVQANERNEVALQMIKSAGVEVDTNASGNNQAGLKYSANGTLVIDIAEASKAGVSHNKFNKYNVSANGLILNNSSNPLISALGGWTDGNRRLSGGSAKIILAEVTGSSSSSLLGYSEVLGSAAEFVLANQNGITCNGCGFINTPKVTFTTGVPDFLDGQLLGFDVSKGSVVFDGTGMNASNISQFDILSRAIILNAALYGDNLNLVTGVNYYDYTTGEITPIVSQGGANVDFALDASSLGGMYANNITLIATEAGVGVRSDGVFNAVNEMELTATGELRLKDTMANDSLTLSSSLGDIVTLGSTYSTNLEVNTEKDLINEGTLAAGDELNIVANNIYQNGAVYSGLNLQGQLTTGASLNIDSQGELVNQGSIVNASDISLAASSLSNLAEGTLQADRLNIDSDILDNQGSLSASDLTINAQAFVNSGDVQAVNIEFNIDALELEQGSIYQFGESGIFSFEGQSLTLNSGMLVTEGDSNIHAADSIVNHSDWLSLGQLSAETSQFTNSGTFEAKEQTSLYVNDIMNSGNLLFAAEASPDIQVINTLNNDNGLLQFSSENVELSTDSLSNKSGSITHLGSGEMKLELTERLDNSQGIILGNQINLTAPEVNNQQGIVQGDIVGVHAQDFVNDQGLTLASGTQDNSLVLNVTRSLSNVEGVIQSSGQAFSLSAEEIDNQKGQIVHIGSELLAIDTKHFNNDEGLLWANTDLSLSVPVFTNQQGQVSAGHRLNVTADEVVNRQGSLLGQSVFIDTDKLTNDQGYIEAEQQLLVETTELHNIVGVLSAQSLELNALDMTNTGSFISEIIQLNALGLENQGSIISQYANLSVSQLNNSGLIRAVNDHQAESSETGELTIDADNLVNRGSIVTDSDDFTLSNLHLDNQYGTLVHSGQGKMTIAPLADLLNQSGAIFTAGALELEAANVSNESGLIQSSQQARLIADKINNDSGNIMVLDQGAMEISVSQTINNQGGRLSAGTIGLSGSELINKNGVIEAFNQSDQALNLNFDTLRNEAGVIASMGNMEIDAEELTNTGTLASKGLMTLNMSGLLNTATAGISASQLVMSVDNIINLGVIEAGDAQFSSADIRNQGMILVDGTLALDTDLLDNTDGLIQTGQNTVLNTVNFNNQNGVLLVTGGDQVSINVEALLDNRQGIIGSNATNNSVQAIQVNNNQGRLEFYQNLELESQQLINHHGLVAANNSIFDVDEIDNTLSGQITSTDSLVINSQSIDSDGTISAAELSLTTDSLRQGQNGEILADNADINTHTLTNEGAIVANHLVIDATQVTNLGLLAGNTALQLSASQLENLNGTINSQGELIIHTTALNNIEGNIHGGQVSITANSLLNEAGEIVGFDSEGKSLALSVTQTLNNLGGVIYAGGGEAIIQADSLLNSGAITFAGQGELSLVSSMISNLDSAILSSASGLIINTDVLENKGVVEAGLLDVIATNVDNSGSILAGELDVTASELKHTGVIEVGKGHVNVSNLINDGYLIASEQALANISAEQTPSLNIIATNLTSTGVMSADNLSIQSDSIANQGYLGASNLNIETDSLTNNADIVAAGGALTSDTLVNRGSIALVGAGELTMDVGSALDNQDGQIFSQGLLAVNTDSLINLDGLIQSDAGLVINAVEVNNTHGKLLASGEQALVINATQHLNNQAGTIAAQRLDITASSLDNSSLNQVSGQILANDIAINSGIIDNTGSQILGDRVAFVSNNLINQQGRIEAKLGLDLAVSQLFDNTTGELVTTADSATINAGQLQNHSGLILQQGGDNLSLLISDSVQNTAGVISSSQGLQLTAKSIDNQGMINADLLSLSATNIDNQANIQANRVVIESEDLLNAGVLLSSSTSPESLVLDVTNGIINTGLIQSSGDTLTLTQAIDNTNGMLVHTGSGALALTSLVNNRGQVYALADLVLSGESLNNDNGVVQTQGSASFTVNSLSNHNGEISAQGENLDFAVRDSLSNQDGVIITEGAKLALQAGDIVNHNGVIASASDLSLKGETLVNIAGLIRAENDLTIDSLQLNNSAGVVSAQNVALLGNRLDNQNGIIESSASMALSFAEINNQSGIVLSKGDSFSFSGLLDNSQGGLLEVNSTDWSTTGQTINNQLGVIRHTGSGVLDLAQNDQLNNQQGTITSLGDIHLSLIGGLNNHQGIVQASSDISLDAQSKIDNREGLLVAEGKLHLNASSLDNQKGQVLSAQGVNLTLVADLNNQDGLIYNQSGQGKINLASLNNSNGVLLHQGAESLSITANSLSNDGEISANNQLNLAVTDLTNTGVIGSSSLNLDTQEIKNTGTLVAELLQINTIDLDNQNGTIYASGEFGESLIINSVNQVNNQSGLIQSMGQELKLASGIDNTQGEILMLGNGLLSATHLINDNGQLLSLGNIALSGDLSNQSGVVEAIGDVNINGGDINNLGGSIHATNQLTLVSDSLNNQGGRITGAGTVYRIDSQILDNSGSGLLATDANSMLITANSLNNQGGSVLHQGGGALTLDGGTINNSAGSLVTQGLLALTANSLVNDNGMLSSQGSQSLTLGSLSNDAGRIESAADLTLALSGNASNQGGIIFAAHSMDLKADGELDNTSGVLLTDGNLAINAGSIINDGGTVQAQEVNLDSVSSISNKAGAISANQVTLAATALDNTGGTILATGSMNNALNLLAVNSLNNTQGILASYAQNWDMVLTGFDNTDGSIIHQGQGTLTLSHSGTLQNSGDLLSNGNLVLSAQDTHNQGQIQAANELTVNGGLNNSSTGVLAANQVGVNAGAESIDNQGYISANTRLEMSGSVVDNSGLLYSQQDLLLSANTVANLGTVSANRVTVEGFEQLSNSGRIESGIAHFTGDELNNDAGFISSLTDQTMNLNRLSSVNGHIESAGNLSIELQGSANNQAGVIYGASGLQIKAADGFNNNAGVILANGGIDIEAGSFSNDAGTVQAQNVTLSSTSYLSNIGGVLSGIQVALSGESLNNSQGTVLASDGANAYLDLSGVRSVNNDQGAILLLGDGLLSATNLVNDNGQLLSSGNIALSGDLSNQSGTVEAIGDVSINGGDINNLSGSIHANNQLTLVSDSLNNRSGRITGAGTVYRIDSQSLDNRGGLLATDANSMLITANSLSNQGGAVLHQGSGTLTLDGGNINNSAGSLVTQGQLALTANSLVNDNGMLSSQGSQRLTLASLSNGAGRIESAADLTMALSGNANNQGGIIFAANSLDLRAGGEVNNTSGVLLADGNLAINAGAIINNSGTVQAQTVNLDSAGSISNKAGAISANQVVLAATALDNSSGTILATSSANNSLNMSAVNSLNNTQGTLASYAQNWDMVLSGFNNAGGALIHQGSGTFSIANSGSLHNSGDIVSKGNLALSANTLSNQGQIQAANSLTINGGLDNNASGVIVGKNISVDAGNKQIDNLGSISAINGLSLSAAAIDNGALLYSQQDLNLSAGNIANSGTMSASNLSANGFAGFENSGRVEASNASFSGTRLTNAATGVLVASGSTASALVLGVSELVNQGTLYNSGANMSFAGSVTNSGQLIHAGTGTLVIGDKGSTNLSGGVVSTAGTASLKGNISGAGSLYAVKGINIDTGSTFTNTDSSLYTQGNLQINSAVDNQGGSLVADGTLAINTSGAVNNSKGVIQGNNLDITAGSLNNNQGTMTSLGGGSGQITATTLDNTDGKIQSSNTHFSLSTTGGNLTNTDGIIAHNGSGVLSLDSQRNIEQQSGLIQTSGELNITAGGNINNNNGVIIASMFDIASSGAFNNASGQLIGFNSGDSRLSASSIDNRQGMISSDGNRLSITTQGLLDNTGGNISSSANGSLNITASSIKNNNSSSYILSNGAINIDGAASLSNSGIISSLTGLSANVGSIVNSGTLGSRNGTVTLDLTGPLTNTGMITGQTGLDISATAINNSGGTLQSDGLVKLDSQSLNIGLINGQDLDIVLRGGLTIASSDTLSASRNITVNTGGNNINNQGRITATGLVDISGQNLTNTGSISAGGNGSLNFNNIANSGTLSSNSTLTVNSNISSNSGTIAAANTLDINGHVTNTNLLFAGNNLTIDGNVTNSSSIYSAGNASLTGTITNNAGSIAAVNNLSLTGTITNNRSGSTTFVEGETTSSTSGGGYPSTGGSYNSSGKRYAYLDKTTKTTTVYNATATGSTGIIAAGGDLSLSGNITNNYSTISAGRNISLSGSNLTNNTAQNKEISDVRVIKETWVETCLQGNSKNNRYTCYEPGMLVKSSEEETDRYTETTYVGGAYGTIVAGGSITGNLSGQLEANDASPETGNKYSADTRASGSRGAASRGNSADSNGQQSASVDSVNGSSLNTSGQGRNATGQSANIGTNVSVAGENQAANGANEVAINGGDDIGLIAQESVDNNGSHLSTSGQDINAEGVGTHITTDVDLVGQDQSFNGANELNIAGNADHRLRESDSVEVVSQEIVSNQDVSSSLRGKKQYPTDKGNWAQDRRLDVDNATTNELKLTSEENDSELVFASVVETGQPALLENDYEVNQYQKQWRPQITTSVESGGYHMQDGPIAVNPDLVAAGDQDLGLTPIDSIGLAPEEQLAGRTGEIAIARHEDQSSGPGGFGVEAQSPEHNYQIAQAGSLTSEQEITAAAETLTQLESKVLMEHEGKVRDEQVNDATEAVSVSANVFMTDDQVKVLTEGLGFDKDIIDDGQQLLYAAVSQNDLLQDGVTISAGTYMDITADESIKIDAGIAANDGLILRTQGDLLTQDTTYFDSEQLLGLQMGGDFTNSANLSSDTLWLDVGGDFTNDATLNGDSQLWLSSGGDFTNNANLLSDGALSINASGDILNQQGLIAGSDVMLNAGGDIINRTEFSQSTHQRGKNSNTYTFIGEESQIISTNSLSMNAGNNIDLQGSSLAANGDISLTAANDILLGAVENKQGSERYFKGGYEIKHDTSYDVVDLRSGGNLSVIAGNNLQSEGAQFIAAGDITLAAANELNLNAVTESHIASSMETDKGFFSTKVTTSSSQHDIVQGSVVQAGGNILLNAIANASGQIAVQQSGDVNIIGSMLTAGSDTIIAGDNINVLAQSYTDYEMASKSKSAFWGLSTSADLDAEKTQKLSSSQLAANGDLTLISADDITIAGSDMLANGNINISAFDELLITSAEESSQVESKSESGGLFSGGNFFSSSESMQGQKSTTAYGSLLNAGSDINIDAGSATVVGSDIFATGSLGVSTDIGDIQVLAAKETTETYSSERQLEVGFGDLLKGLTNPTDAIKVEDGQLKLSIANANYDKVDFSSSETSHKGSSLTANGNVTLDSVADILVEGSDLIANADATTAANDATPGDINLLAGGNVTIKEAENSYEESLEEVHGSAEMSVVVQHQAVEVAKAAIAVKEAHDQVKQAEKDYRTYKKERDNLENSLTQLEADYNNGVPGVNYADVIEMRELLEDVKSDEEWYVAGVALAAANAVSKTTGLVQQTAAAAASTGTYGFNAGVQLDIEASQTESNFEQTTSLASNLSGNNINIATGLNSDASVNNAISSVNIQGSHLGANNGINIVTDELNITASRDTSASSSETQNGNITIAQTVWGAAGGPTVSASYDRNQSKDKTTTYNNSTLTGTDINITTSGDTRIEGGNLTADNSLNLDIGGDLLLESKQNRASGSNKGFGVSGGFSFGGDTSKNTGKSASTSFNSVGDTSQGVSSVNGGLNASNGRYQSKETVLSSITGSEVNIDVAGNTAINGALIAAVDADGADNGQLTFSTDTISFTDLNNTSFSNQQSLGLSTSVGISDKANVNDPNQSNTDMTLNTSTLSYSNESSYDKSKTLATLGNGAVTIGGVEVGTAANDSAGNDSANDELLAGLNRDTDNIDKEFYSVDRQQGNVDLTVDHRLLSEDGRAQIKNDFVDTHEFGEDIVAAAGSLNESDALGLLDFWSALHNNAQATDLKNDLLRNPENAYILEGLKSGDGDEYAAAMQELGALAQDKFGLELTDVTLYDGNQTSSESLMNMLVTDVKGGVVNDPNNEHNGEIFIDAGDGASKTDLIDTLGHETIELQAVQQGGEHDDTQEALADAFGVQLASRVDQAAGGDLDSTGGAGFNDSLRNSQAVASGTQRADEVGGANVEHSRVRLDEAQTLDRIRGAIGRDTSLSTEEQLIAQTQVNALACAAVSCADGVPTDDPLYKELKTLQSMGEGLNDQGVTIGALIGEEEAGQFERGFMDIYVNDTIQSLDEELTVVGGAGQAVAGALGVYGGGTLAVAGGVGCGPSAGLSCLLVPAGAAVAEFSRQDMVAGFDKVTGDYQHTEGGAVADSLYVDNHPGEVNPLLDLTVGAGVSSLEALSAKVGGKLLGSALEKYKGGDGESLPSGYTKHEDGSITGPGNGKATDSGMRTADGSTIYKRDSKGHYYIDENGKQQPVKTGDKVDLQAARQFHNQRQTDAASSLNMQGADTVSEVTIKNSDGVVARTDIVVQGKSNGTLDIPEGFSATDIHGNPVTQIPLDANGRAMVEIKTGSADLTANQKACYGDACGIGGVTGRGKKADDVEFRDTDAPNIVIILRDKSRGS
ncbi:filamentous hemagglutinin N-terminal domain-containing protein [Shewanella sp. UCD-KL12]|uniref:filamentous hemagglutinin N-terminal domain-containing protein n=1 Tax=Shewanella sp. UCD-KL12 TaxID=1917163 RepID=UPI0009711E2A|nr:filamentous hemagglutinin N-terminal domain-containing protein [Shewanella sp. UCD-KL12]